MDDSLAHTEKSFDYLPEKTSIDGFTSRVENVEVPVGRENLSEALPPHESYEGRHRWDPSATWTQQEERHVVRKTDLYLLSWICIMVCWCF